MLAMTAGSAGPASAAADPFPAERRVHFQSPFGGMHAGSQPTHKTLPCLVPFPFPQDDWLSELLGAVGAQAFCVLSVNGDLYTGVLQVHRYKDGRDIYIQVNSMGDPRA